MRLFNNRSVVMFGLVSMIAFSFVTGMYVNEVACRPDASFPKMLLKADSAVTGERFALATGKVDENVDGIYTLDFLTGELQLAVLSRRTGTFNNVFRTNVVADLGVGQNTKYLMVTGNISIPRGAQAAKAAESAVYILDTTSGNFAAYTAPWRPEFATAGRPQSAELVRIDFGKARNAAIRD